MFRLVHKIPLVFGFQPCLEYKYVYIASDIVTNSICRFTRRPLRINTVSELRSLIIIIIIAMIADDAHCMSN